MAATYSKPTVIPRWADTGTRVVPSAGKLNSGWTFEEAPAYGWENWLQGITGDWWKWIDERLDDGVDEDSFKIIQPEAGNDIMLFELNEVTLYEPVTIDPSGSTLTNATGLTAEGKGTGNGAVIEGGATNATGLVVTANGTGKGAEITGGPTSGGGLSVTAAANGAGIEVTSVENPALILHTDVAPTRGTISMTEITTAPSSPFDGDIWLYHDRLYGRFNGEVTTVTPAAWATVAFTSAPSVSLVRSFNCASVACVGGGSIPIIITLDAARPISITSTCIVATMNTIAYADHLVTAIATSSLTISIQCYDIGAGAYVNFDNLDGNLSVIVYNDN